MEMRQIVPGTIPVKDMHQFIIGSIAPRPIAFVSTMDEDGNPNLAPFSFFNAFSSNPPTFVFSANRRVRDNSTKHTLHNIQATRECVINVVSYPIVRQMAVTSIDWPEDVNEFAKSGLTSIPSEKVKPFRVRESPVQFECKVRDIITLGDHGGAGHLIICEALLMHIAEDIIDERNRIVPDKIDLMGRMGRAYYVRASGDAVHTVVQPFEQLTIGYDTLPESIRLSKILTGNDLGQIAGITAWPSEKFLEDLMKDFTIKALLAEEDTLEKLHHIAHVALEKGQRDYAAGILMIADRLNQENSGA